MFGTSSISVFQLSLTFLFTFHLIEQGNGDFLWSEGLNFCIIGYQPTSGEKKEQVFTCTTRQSDLFKEVSSFWFPYRSSTQNDTAGLQHVLERRTDGADK